MNVEMAYLLGMILGNGEIQRGNIRSRITIEIPHKNLKTDDGLEVSVYVKASLVDINRVIRPLISTELETSQARLSTKIWFEKDNNDYMGLKFTISLPQCWPF